MSTENRESLRIVVDPFNNRLYIAIRAFKVNTGLGFVDLAPNQQEGLTKQTDEFRKLFLDPETTPEQIKTFCEQFLQRVETMFNRYLERAGKPKIKV